MNPKQAEAIPLYKVEEDPRDYKIERWGDGWHVSGKAIERAAAMTYWEHYGSVRRFQRLMKAIGLEADLRKAGISEGENVIINEYTLEWQD